MVKAVEPTAKIIADLTAQAAAALERAEASA
jgi:hypothetical protein